MLKIASLRYRFDLILERQSKKKSANENIFGIDSDFIISFVINPINFPVESDRLAKNPVATVKDDESCQCERFKAADYLPLSSSTQTSDQLKTCYWKSIFRPSIKNIFGWKNFLRSSSSFPHEIIEYFLHHLRRDDGERPKPELTLWTRLEKFSIFPKLSMITMIVYL